MRSSLDVPVLTDADPPKTRCPREIGSVYEPGRTFAAAT